MTMLIARKTAPSLKKKNNKGFSLIELIIVITIMAILTALIAPQLLRYVEQSRVAKDLSSIDEVYRAIQISLADETIFKATTTGNTVTFKNGTTDNTSTLTASTGALATDLHKTLGGKLDTTVVTLNTALVSNTYKGKTITFTITITDGIISVTKAEA